MAMFLSTMTSTNFPFALHTLREKALAAGCLGGLGELVHTTAPLARV